MVGGRGHCCWAKSSATTDCCASAGVHNHVSFICCFGQNEIKMFASPQHEVKTSELSALLWVKLFSGGSSQLHTTILRVTAAIAVVSSNMFIEKNGRNFCFGQLTIKGWSFVSPSRLIALYQKGHTAAKKCRTWPEKEEEEESVAASPFLKRLTTRSNWDWRGVKQHTVHSALLLNCLSHSVYNLVTLATTENHLIISTNVNQ